MSGDNLNALLFFASIGAGAAMGAIATNGTRARVLWGIGLIALIAAAACLYADAASPLIRFIRAMWITAPFIAVTMAILVSGGRKPLERPIQAKRSVLNPALTAEHLNRIISDCTELEAKRRLDAHKDERAQLKGEVLEVKEAVFPAGIRVYIAFPGDVLADRTMRFRPSQADQLAVIKRGDWIEFTGRVEHAGHYGWGLVDCEFVGLAEKPKAPRRRSGPKTDPA